MPTGSAAVRAMEIARGIAAHSPVALRQAKRAMRLGSGVDLAAGLEVEDACWRATAFSPIGRRGLPHSWRNGRLGGPACDRLASLP